MVIIVASLYLTLSSHSVRIFSLLDNIVKSHHKSVKWLQINRDTTGTLERY